jgi:hypothetical protein
MSARPVRPGGGASGSGLAAEIPQLVASYPRLGDWLAGAGAITRSTFSWRTRQPRVTQATGNHHDRANKDHLSRELD